MSACTFLGVAAARAPAPWRAAAVAGFSTQRFQAWAEKRDNLSQMDGREELIARRFETRVARMPRGILEQRELTKEIRNLSRARRWEEALARFRACEDPDAHTYTAMVAACTMSGEERWARKVLDEMPIKTLQAYTALFQLLGRMGQIHQLEELLHQMEGQGIQPDAFCLRTIVVGYGVARDVESAVRVFRDMEARGLVLGEGEFSAVLTACGKGGDSKRAQELFAEMDSRFLQADVGHFTSLIVSHARAKDEEGARRAFAEMRRRRIKPDIVAYTSLLSCLAGPGSLQKGDEIVAELKQEGLTPHVFLYNQLLRLAAESEETARFEAILEEMDSRGISRNYVIQGQIRELERQAAAHVPRTATAESPLASGTTARKEVQAPPQSSALPEGWREALDPASGMRYYWRVADPHNTTTWERPQAA